ncbi:hypothetical protein JCM3765_006960 [Sporobolomyces pararoseus]
MPALPSAQDLQQQVLKFIATIPKDQNPYVALADYIQDAIVPKIPFSGLVQLYLLAATFGLTLLFVVASILVRWYKGIFWLFQVSHSPTLIRPHFSLSWSTVSVFMLALFEGYIFECVNLFKRNIRPSLGYWVCLIWTICFVGGECAAWALGVSYLVHVQASGGGRNGDGLRTGGDKIDRWAKVSNFAGILCPIIYLAIILPLGVITGRHFYEAISILLKVDAILREGEASKNWKPGQPLSILALTPALPLVTKLESSQASLVTGWKWTYGAYSVLTCILVTVLTTISILYLTSLRQRIKQNASDLHGVDGSRSASQQIRLTYQTLQWTIGAFVLLGVIFVSIASYAAATPESLQYAITSQILVLGPLWSFAVFGFPTSISLFWRAIDATSSDGGKWGESSGTHSGSGGKGSRSLRRQVELDAVKQYSIELNGRRPDRTAVNVTVDVLIKEEGELEKWESLSSMQKL